ncbi:ABC transporter, putative [Bodo saltans]|uniref:ABC transporter, putative n=1 Tax=Bodo saltans TaxID=75058 RepID=A0A0S4J3N1_BODSA|nr:ABC transporter, putative [Bodo saltans]|eukprot:CUG72719.1 ABC transporter, putative [Bodo saltans]
MFSLLLLWIRRNLSNRMSINIADVMVRRLREISTSPQDASLRRLLIGSLLALVAYVFAAWLPFRRACRRASAKGRTEEMLVDDDGADEEGTATSSSRRSSWKHFLRILKIAFPKLRSTQGKYLAFLTVLLFIRTQLSVVIARKLGNVAGALIQGNRRLFITTLLTFIAWTIPAAVINNGLTFCVGVLQLSMREKLTKSFHARYFQPGVFFQIAGLSEACGGVTFIEQRMTQDLQRWSNKAVSLYTVLFKPLLDIVLFSREIANMKHGNYRGPLVIGGYYAVISVVLQYITPSFGAMASVQAEKDAAYRRELVRQLNDAKEIALCRSEATEVKRLKALYNASSDYVHYSAALRAWADFVDGFFLRGMSIAVGTGVVGWIVDGRYQELAAEASSAATAAAAVTTTVPGKNPLSAEAGAELAALFIHSSTMLMHLTRSVGQLVQAYRSVSLMSGFSNRVHQLHVALQLAEEHESRRKTERELESFAEDGNDSFAAAIEKDNNNASVQRPPSSAYRLSPYISFEHVTLATPPVATTRRRRQSLSTSSPAQGLTSPSSSSESSSTTIPPQPSTPRILCRDLTFTIKPGMNVLVVGPNGCGKSSMFRVLAELWPLTSPPPLGCSDHAAASEVRQDDHHGYGVLSKPSREQLYYVSQRPYMSAGSLMEQVIYPSRKKEVRVGESDLTKFLEIVGLESIFDRPNISWESRLVWSKDEVLSPGEKQKLALARMFYHNPRFAILDECTSALDVETESRIYRACQERGITVFSIAHRRSVWGAHNWALKFDEHGQYVFSPMKLVAMEGNREVPLLPRGGVATGSGIFATNSTPATSVARGTPNHEDLPPQQDAQSDRRAKGAVVHRRKTFLLLTKIAESNNSALVGTTAKYLVEVDGKPVEIDEATAENDGNDDENFATPMSSLRYGGIGLQSAASTVSAFTTPSSSTQK